MIEGDYARALDDANDSVRLDPDSVHARIVRARILAKCPDEKWRDGPRAVADATRACELTAWNTPAALFALAASHAETGDFAEAVRRQEEALKLSKAKGYETPRQDRDLVSLRERKPLRISLEELEEVSNPHQGIGVVIRFTD